MRPLLLPLLAVLAACRPTPAPRTCPAVSASALDGLPSPAFGVDLVGVPAQARPALAARAAQLGLGWARLELPLSAAGSAEALEEAFSGIGDRLAILARVSPAEAVGPRGEEGWDRLAADLGRLAGRLAGRARTFEIGRSTADPGTLAAARLDAALFETSRKALRAGSPDALAISAAPLAPEALRHLLRDPAHPAARFFDGLALPTAAGPLAAVEGRATAALETLCLADAVAPLWLVPSGADEGAAADAVARAVVAAELGGRAFWRARGPADEGLAAFAAVARLLSGARFVAKRSAEGRTAVLFETREAEVGVYFVSAGELHRDNGEVHFDFLGRPVLRVGAPGGFVVRAGAGR